PGASSCLFLLEDAERNGLDRRLAAQPAYRLDRQAGVGGRDLLQRRAADAALAAAHAAAGDGLDAVDVDGAEVLLHGPADLARRHMLAAADGNLVRQAGERRNRPAEGSRQPPLEAAQAGEPAAQDRALVD